MSDSDPLKPNSSDTFSFDDVMRHIRTHHPGCPKKTCLTIAARVSIRDRKDLKRGAAVGIELQKHIRHAYTGYDELLRSKMMTREEAQAFIASQIAEILRSWQQAKLKLRLVQPKPED